MVVMKPGVVCPQVHGEVVRIFAEGADQHLKHEEQAKQRKASAAKTGTSYQPRLDPFPVPLLVDYLHKCLAATKHSRKCTSTTLYEAHRILQCALSTCTFGVAHPVEQAKPVITEQGTKQDSLLYIVCDRCNPCMHACYRHNARHDTSLPT